MQDLADRLPPRLGRTVRRMVAIKLTYSAIATLILPLTFLMVVIFRYVLHRDLFAYEEWLLPISFWLYFMASAVATYQDTQIRADVLESLFRTPRSIWIRRICLTAIEIVITLAIVYWGWLMIVNDISAYPFWQKTIALKIPFFVPHLGIFIGLVFMLLYSSLHLYVLLKFGPETVMDKPRVDPDAVPESGEAA